MNTSDTIQLNSEPKAKEYIVTSNEIIAAISYWGIRQSPYWVPKNLQVALEAVQKHLAETYDGSEKKSVDSYKLRGEKEIAACVRSAIFDVRETSIWNVTQVEIDNGITDPNDPKRKVRYGVTGIGISTPQDRDFIDLDALYQNVLNMVLTD